MKSINGLLFDYKGYAPGLQNGCLVFRLIVVKHSHYHKYYTKVLDSPVQLEDSLGKVARYEEESPNVLGWMLEHSYSLGANTSYCLPLAPVAHLPHPKFPMIEGLIPLILPYICSKTTVMVPRIVQTPMHSWHTANRLH